MELYLGEIKLNGPKDKLTVMALGAALINYWDELPIPLREAIYDLACSGRILGLPQKGSAKQRIDDLLSRNTPEAV